MQAQFKPALPKECLETKKLFVRYVSHEVNRVFGSIFLILISSHDTACTVMNCFHVFRFGCIALQIRTPLNTVLIGAELAQSLRRTGIERAFAMPLNSSGRSSIMQECPKAEEIVAAKTNLNALFDM